MRGMSADQLSHPYVYAACEQIFNINIFHHPHFEMQLERCQENSFKHIPLCHGNCQRFNTHSYIIKITSSVIFMFQTWTFHILSVQHENQNERDRCYPVGLPHFITSCLNLFGYYKYQFYVWCSIELLIARGFMFKDHISEKVCYLEPQKFGAIHCR